MPRGRQPAGDHALSDAARQARYRARRHAAQDWGAPVLSEGQIAYAALDAVLAFQLWRKLWVELHAKGRCAAYALQRDVTPATVGMIRRGITLDLDAHQRQVAKWEAEAAAARQAFITEAREAPPVTPMETRAFLMKVLPPQVIEAWPRTPKSGELSTESPELRRRVDIPAIRSLLIINAMTKLQSTFGRELAKKVSAVTGRLRLQCGVDQSGAFQLQRPHPPADPEPHGCRVPRLLRRRTGQGARDRRL